jgi:hypothetical protein
VIARVLRDVVASSESDRSAQRQVRARVGETRQAVVAALPDLGDIEVVPIVDHRLARGLHEFAEAEDAAMLVLGSSHHHALGRRLLRGIAFELAFAAAIIYLPPVQSLFHTAPLVWWQLALLAAFPVLVWGTDEAYRAWRRRRTSPVGAVRRARPAPPEVRNARA